MDLWKIVGLFGGGPREFEVPSPKLTTVTFFEATQADPNKKRLLRDKPLRLVCIFKKCFFCLDRRGYWFYLGNLSSHG